MAAGLFPFERLNLRRNPFGAVPDGDWRGLVVTDLDLDAVAALLAQPGFAIQLRGEMGRGKSTLLRALHARFPEQPYTYVGEGERPRVPEAPVIFVDEAQRLPWWQRALLFRRRASFAIATHGDHRRELWLAGLTVLGREAGGLDERRLAEVVSRRLEWARLDRGAVPELDEGALAFLLERFGDDLRAIEALLYEVFQDLQEVTRVEVRHLRRAAQG